jgi:hypothetical protein
VSWRYTTERGGRVSMSRSKLERVMGEGPTLVEVLKRVQGKGLSEWSS